VTSCPLTGGAEGGVAIRRTPSRSIVHSIQPRYHVPGSERVDRGYADAMSTDVTVSIAPQTTTGELVLVPGHRQAKHT